jgi:hypothetical protein
MRRLLLPLLMLPVLLVAGHYLLWRWSERQMATQTDDWIAAQRAQGWTIRTGEGVGGGWPLTTERLLPDVTIAGGDSLIPGGLTWKADRVRLRVALLHPRALTIGMEGLQTLRLGAAPELHFAADDMTAVLPLEPGVPARTLDLTAAHLRAGLPAQGTGGITITDLTLHALTRPGTTQGDAALTLSLAADNIGLPAGIDWALGPTIARVALDAAIDGPVPRATALATRLAGWRDGGGTVPIQSLTLDWGPLSLRASATLALDEQLQPMGAATARIAGWSQALDALTRGGLLPARSAMAAKAVLSLLARPPEGGGPEEVEVPLTDQDRTLSFGRIPLTKLPEVVWPP